MALTTSCDGRMVSRHLRGEASLTRAEAGLVRASSDERPFEEPAGRGLGAVRAMSSARTPQLAHGVLGRARLLFAEQALGIALRLGVAARQPRVE